MGALLFKHVFWGSFVESGETFQTVLIIFLLIPCSLSVDYRAAPLMPDETFLWAWNVPAEVCIGNFSSSLDMSFFSLVGSPRKTATGQPVTIFYNDRLGKYPYIDEQKVEHFGGIPQNVNLQEHLDKAKADIEYYIPVDQLGLAVIDWEEWRPTWDRNWIPKDIYKATSVKIVQSQNPGMDIAQVLIVARKQFEDAGRKLMEETLKLGKQLRPQYLWGYFLFPDCYNYQNYTEPGYDGKCPRIEIERNNNLTWLWQKSTALYPSTYLKSELKLSPNAKLYNRYRVLEAIRMSKFRAENNPLPVFLYTRVIFSDRIWDFLSIDDLVNTIGEAVALGTSGVVIWDSISIAQRGPTGCPTLQKYMKNTLYPYMINVTLAAKMCSQTLCDNQGICTRKNENSSHYIQLNPKYLEIQLSHDGKYEVVGYPRVGDLKYFSDHFKCTCYTNMSCKERLDIEDVATVKVCTRNGICLDTDVEYDAAFYLLPAKSIVFFIAATHMLYQLIQDPLTFLGQVPVGAP